MPLPSEQYFPGKQPDEITLLVVRRHPAALGFKVIELFFGLVVVVAGYIMIGAFTTWLDDQTSLSYLAIVLVASLTVLFFLVFLYHAWVDYYLDIWIVTNERIVATEQRGLFNRVVSEVRLNRIQDVSSEVVGFIPTMFRFGTVHIQTASETGNFKFTEVPHPEIVARQILEYHEHALAASPEMVPASPPPSSPPPPANGRPAV